MHSSQDVFDLTLHRAANLQVLQVLLKSGLQLLYKCLNECCLTIDDIFIIGFSLYDCFEENIIHVLTSSCLVILTVMGYFRSNHR